MNPWARGRQAAACINTITPVSTNLYIRQQQQQQAGRQQWQAAAGRSNQHGFLGSSQSSLPRSVMNPWALGRQVAGGGRQRAANSKIQTAGNSGTVGSRQIAHSRQQQAAAGIRGRSSRQQAAGSNRRRQATASSRRQRASALQHQSTGSWQQQQQQAGSTQPVASRKSNNKATRKTHGYRACILQTRPANTLHVMHLRTASRATGCTRAELHAAIFGLGGRVFQYALHLLRPTRI